MKILVAVDPSDSVHLPVSRAVAMAKKEGAELTLISVAETVEDMESLFVGEYTEWIKKRASQALDAAQAMAKAAGVPATVLLETGASPAEFIVDTAESTKADLVVMGTRGKKGVGRLLLGSVAGKVVSLAPCSVMVVR